MKREWKKRMAAVLSALLVFNNLGAGGGILAKAGVRSRLIEEFEELSGDTLFQTVPFGTKKKALDLPRYLNARLAEEESEENEENEDGGHGNGGGKAPASSQAAATGSEAYRADGADEADSTSGALASPSDMAGGTGAGSSESGGTGSGGDKKGVWRKVKVRWVLNEDFSEQETYDGEIPGIYVFEAELADDRYELSGAELPVIEAEVLEKAEKEEGFEATPSEILEEISEEMVVTDWTYLDGDSLSEDGSLTLYEKAYGFDDVVSLLPGRIQAVAEEDGHTIILSLTWDSPDYRERQETEEWNESEERGESEEGEESKEREESEEQAADSYRFRWELPEGYILSEDAGEPELWVTLITGELSLEEQARRMEQQMAGERLSRVARSLVNGANRTNRTGGFCFTVGSEAVLRELSQKVEAGAAWADGTVSYAESSYVLTGDIRLTEEWIPVGTEEKPFTGIFDGGGYVIYDMVIDDPDLNNGGLFGYVKGGIVENLGVQDADLLGCNSIGLVAGGVSEGTVSRCYSTGYVEAVGAENPLAGGIVGFAEEGSTVADCYSLADAKSAIAGGIAGGIENSEVVNCYSTGKITASSTSVIGGGGLVGSFTVDENKSIVMTDSAALNPSITTIWNNIRRAARLYGVETTPPHGEYTATLRGNYGFSGMMWNGQSISGGQNDDNNGEDFRYDAATGTFSTPWETIFGSSDAWDFGDGKLPTLKGVRGQDGEIPDWMLYETADLYIGSAQELAAFRDRVNGADGGAEDNFAGRTVRLTADIELDGSTDWMPIGSIDFNPNAKFSGVFDGGGHVISGLSVFGEQSGNNHISYAGLFGLVDAGEIRNLGLRDVDISGYSDYAGAVAGMLYQGVIAGCYSTGTVSTENKNSNGYAGGIAGGISGINDSSSTVENCYSTAAVRGGSFAGGITGNIVAGTVVSCYFAGNAVNGRYGSGGISGNIETINGGVASIEHCAALNLAVEDTPGNNGTSEAARITCANKSYGNRSFINNYAFSGMKVNGNVIPEGDASVGANLPHGEGLSYDRSTGAFNVPWETILGQKGVKAWDIEAHKLPSLKGVRGQDGEIPAWLSDDTADLYIGSARELAAFRDRVNGADGKEADNFAGKTVRLTADITLGGSSDWTPIGEGVRNGFSGTFDGDGHVIRGLKINDEDKKGLGLFGWISKGTVRNLGLEEVRINGKDFIGGIAGNIDKGSSVLNCYSMGSVRGNGSVGGLVGSAGGKFQGEDDSQKAVIRNCWHAGDVKARIGSAGGIAGNFSYGCEMEHCYSTGKTASTFTAGGLIGYVADSSSIDEFTGAVRYNAALTKTVDGSDGVGRIYGHLYVSSAGSGWKDNYAWSGMTVGGETVSGDDGTGKNGKDGAPADIVMNKDLFPDSDWICREGHYPALKKFAGRMPLPLDPWLEDQADGAFKISLTPDSYRFPDAEAGYGAQAGAVFTVENTGKVDIDGLTVSLTDPWTDAAEESGAAKPYFVLSGTESLAHIDVGDSAAFTVTPAAGLHAGSYRMTVSVTGEHERKAEAEAEFTVKPKAEPEPEPAPQPKTKRDSDRGFTVKWPVYTYLNGEVPSSAGSGSWEKQPGGVWKFHKDGSADAPGSGAAGPAASVINGAGYAANEWLYIDGFWYLFDADGRMVVDWACVNGAWYYLSTAEYAAADAGLKEGAMVTGWLFDPFTRQWYWLDKSGVMAAGWVEIDGRRYYFNPESDGKRGALKEEP